MRKRQLMQIDLTPMIDCVFILLIFFVATATMQEKKSTLKIDLPDTNSEIAPPDQKNHALEISETELALDSKKIDRTGLGSLLKALPAESVLSIYIDKNCRYEQIAPILKEIQTAGTVQIDLVVEAK